MAQSSDVTDFADFRTHLRGHLDERMATSRPLFITNNGRTEAVVLSPAAYDELKAQAELAKTMAGLDRSMEDIKAGRTQPFNEAIRGIAQELGLKLDR